MAKKAKSRRPGLLRTLLAVLVVLALAATLLFTVFRRQVDTMEYPCRYNEYVEYYAGKYNIDPLILYSFIRTESNFNPNAQSNVGARGLMQITEETFDWIKLKIANDEPLTFEDLWDPSVNIRFGTYYLSRCLERYGFRQVGTWQFDDASALISRLANNNWHIPYGLNAASYRPQEVI